MVSSALLDLGVEVPEATRLVARPPEEPGAFLLEDMANGCGVGCWVAIADEPLENGVARKYGDSPGRTRFVMLVLNYVLSSFVLHISIQTNEM